MMEMTPKQQKGLIFILVLVIILLTFRFYSESKKEPIIISRAEGESRRELMVHVAGAVVHPGIYVMEEGQRIRDAIDRAGGALEDGNIHALNLAKRLIDEEKVFVPKVNSSQGETGKGSGLININAAGSQELQKLSGIGPKLAEEIIMDREKRGPFATIEEIQRVSGIGEKTFERFRDFITVE